MSDDKAGPTGRYPHWKLNEEDEGELAVRIAGDPAAGVVRLDFGALVRWLAFPPAQVDDLCAMLQKAAQRVREGAQ